MPNENENIEEVKAAEVAETKEAEVVELPAVELGDDDIETIESSVLTQNEGKTKEELAAEIEAAKESYIKEQQEILVKLDEIKAREGNTELSDDDAFAIYEQELDSDEPTKKTVEDSENPFESISTTSEYESGAGSDSPEILSQRLKEYESTLNDPAVKEFLSSGRMEAIFRLSLLNKVEWLITTHYLQRTCSWSTLIMKLPLVN